MLLLHTSIATKWRYFRFAICLLPVILLSACGTSAKQPELSARPVGKRVEIAVPLGLPPLPVPPDNPPTADTIALGRKLYYDPKVSADNTVSCATCHNPSLGFADGRRVSLGVAGQSGKRSAPTVLNAAYWPVQFWDGRAASLEDQAGGPIANPVEMNHPHDVFVSKLNRDPEYVALFAKAFGPGPITLTRIENAVASFERTLLSGNSPFDRYQYGGDKHALSPAAIRGLAVFRDEKRANCAACHTIEEKYALFTDGKFHNLGAGMDENGELTDLGRYNETHVEADRGAFRTPTLRNIAKTAPYMHDGGQKTLKDVVDFYVGGGNSNPQLDSKIKKLELSGRERADLVAFLESLTGETPPHSGPPGTD